jgi:hypothetical protein
VRELERRVTGSPDPYNADPSEAVSAAGVAQKYGMTTEDALRVISVKNQVRRWV